MANYKFDQNCFVFVDIHLISCLLLTFVYFVLYSHFLLVLSGSYSPILFLVSCSPLLFLCSLSFPLHTCTDICAHKCLCICVPVCLGAGAHVYVQVIGQSQVSCLRYWELFELQSLTESGASQVGQSGSPTMPGIHHSLPPQCSVYRCVPSHIFFHMGSEDSAQVLVLSRHIVY